MRKGLKTMDYRIETLPDIPVPVVGVKKAYATGQKAQENIFKFWRNLKQWVTKIT